MESKELAKVAKEGALAQGATVSPALIYLSTLAASGRRSQHAALTHIATGMLGAEGLESTPWHLLRFEHVQAVSTRLQEEGKAPATVNRYLCALRGVARAAWQLGLMDAETYHRIAAVRGVRYQALPAGRALGSGEIAALMRSCAEDRTPAGARDAAVLALAYGAGLRRAELAALDIEDIHQEREEPTITLRVAGKGRKERLAYLDNGAADALRDYLRARGDLPGPLFYAGRKGGHLEERRMTSQAIRDIVARRAAKAAVAHASPHDLRRSFVSDLLDGGVDIATVAAMAGHANINTTARYDRRGEQAKKRAARALLVPYFRA